MENRGRPSEQVERLDKWTIDSTDYDGSRSIIKFDRSKSSNGPYLIEHIPPKGYRQPKPKIDQKPYGCLLYTSPSPRDRTRSRMPSSA